METTITFETIDQRRARHAWQIVRIVREQPKLELEKFCNTARNLPVRIMGSGLGQALAFLIAKRHAPALLAALGDWILDKRSDPRSTQAPPNKRALLKRIIEEDSEYLRLATGEALAYLQWLKRFAEAEKMMVESEETGQ